MNPGAAAAVAAAAGTSSDVNVKSLIDFHKGHGKDATLTATFPPGRFGAIDIRDNQIHSFKEKTYRHGYN